MKRYYITALALLWGALPGEGKATEEESILHDFVQEDVFNLQETLNPQEEEAVRRPQQKQNQSVLNRWRDSDGHLFGFRNSMFHASLQVRGDWTDNLYNHKVNKESNFLTTISPSVWMTWPRRHRRVIQIIPDNTAPGGLQYSQTDYDVFNRYQVYLAANLDFLKYSSNSDLDHMEGSFEGLIQYRPGTSKFNLNLMDKYSRSQDIFNINESRKAQNRVYDSNILAAGADWYISEKFSLKAHYRNFFLVYEEPENQFMDRVDNGLDAAFYYKYSPKTNFFLSYQYFLAAYDQDTMPDNSNTFLHLGINWQATVKTSVMTKLGYQYIDYDTLELRPHLPDNKSLLSFESQGIWQASMKSNLILNAKYSVEQTDSILALNKTVFALRLGGDYRFTDKIRGDVNFIYENSDYDQFQGPERVDDRYYFRPEVQFALNKWLFLGVYYSYDYKTSTIKALDYKTNTLGLGLRGTI
jgi:hypothetical protein